jgi:integrase
MERTKRHRSREGSIYPTSVTVKGKTYTYWVVARTLGPHNGRQQRQTFRFTTEKEARRKLSELLKGTPKKPGPNLTLEEYLKQWLTTKRKLTATTARRYEDVARTHINPVLGRVRLDKLGPDDVERLLDALAKKRSQRGGKLSSTTVRKVYTVLSTALNDAKKKRLIPYNPAESVEAPEIANFEARVFSPDEAARFFEAVNGDAVGPVFAVTLALGLRLGEVLGLTWDQIDADWGGLWIRQQLQWIEPRHIAGRPIIRQLAYSAENGKAKPYLVRPKTKSSIAWLPLPQEIAVILKAHNARQSRGDDGLVFTTVNGTPYSFRNVERSHEHFLTKAGLPKSRFHDLRHSCQSFLNALGVDPKTASQILRHANVRTTLDIYTHISPEQKRKAIDLLGRLLVKPVPQLGRIDTE